MAEDSTKEPECKMTHTGKWKGRAKMAWATWWLGAAMCALGGVGLMLGKETETLIMSGGGMVTGIVAIMVAGKVIHDKGKV